MLLTSSPCFRPSASTSRNLSSSAIIARVHLDATRVDGLSSLPGTALPGAGAPLDAAGEATVALQQLGYKPVEVTRLVQKVAAEGDSAEAIIRKALRAALGA